MKWNVYYYNINMQKIEVYNIFEHGSFVHYVAEAIKECKDKESFAEQLKRELRYYFWSKSEWELIVEITKDNRIFLNPWVGCREPEKVRIDVTDNTDFDWRGFAETHIGQQIWDNEAKIDVYDQVMYRWNIFVDYVFTEGKRLYGKS